jgi:hypothetical protein
MLQMHELRSRERLLLNYNGKRQQKNGPMEFSTGPFSILSQPPHGAS